MQLLKAADVGVVMPEEDEPSDPAMIEVLNEPLISAAAKRLDDIHVEGSGFDIAMNPVVPEDVDTSTLVLTGVANESALISSAVVVLDGLLLESVPAVSTVPDVVRLGFTTDVLVMLDVPFSALIWSAVVVPEVLLFESVLAVSRPLFEAMILFSRLSMIWYLLAQMMCSCSKRLT